MPFHVKCGEIDRDNIPVGEPRMLATLSDRASAEAFIEGEIARYDHNGFVPDGDQAGWWGRNDSERFEKFHFWIEADEVAAPPTPIRNEQYRGLP
jgi:hypothetical protein